ncbi:MAG: DUF2726 domain-containing protein [Clostridium sp.]|nr:DUF2726 domain-containing protein [Clostridium sp.]
MATKKTTKEFKEEIYSLFGDGYIVLDEYIDSLTPIKLKHTRCNNEFDIKPKIFLNRKKCPHCNPLKNKKSNTVEFKEKVYSMYENEYDIIGEYINNSTKIKMKHNKCGNEYKVTPQDFLSGRRCPECAKKIRAKKQRKTTEEFKQEVYNLVKDEYEVLGEYIKSSTKIKMKHNKCGNEYKVTPQDFLSGKRCPECAKKIRADKKRKTTEKFKQEVYDRVEKEYTVLGEYINTETHIKMKHNKCGYTYTVTPHGFLAGRRCPKCSRKLATDKQRKSTKEFKQEVYNLAKDEYEVLGEYVDCRTYVKMKHNKCGYIYKVIPNSFLSGRRCPKCSGLMKKTTEEFKQEVYNLVKDEYEVLGEYINSNTHIEIKHNKCGYIYKAAPNSFLSGNRCVKCSGLMKKTTEEFKQEVYNLVKDEYEVLGEYTNAHAHIDMKHNNCGNIYRTTRHDFLRGVRCPKCSTSKGELAIINFLDRYSVNYKHNAAYGGCSYKISLRFDFLIFDKKDNLKLIVEFDGIQHFKPIAIFRGKSGFKETQKRDRIKNNFCKENDIPLLRIPYWEFDNIYKILGKKLYKLGLI